MEKIAIDLLWLRPGKVGGTESFIRNLLDGFCKLEEEFSFTLLVSRDNGVTFEKYREDKRFDLLYADIESANIAKRIIWQNLYQNRFLREHGFKKCFEPVYCKPWLNGGIEYTCVIHDLQAYHYPKYHPLHEVVYSRICWRMDTWNAKKMIAISNWVKEDIEKKYHRKGIKVIYNPILVHKEDVLSFAEISDKYHVEEKNFFYTVSQMIPHKNLITLIHMMKKLVQDALAGQPKHNLPLKLVITGIKGNAATELKKTIEEKKLQDNIILTGFVSNEERNTLYKFCHTFLFPSIFEGFGMPPIEAMFFGSNCVTTRCASIPEVTQDAAFYVDNPFDIEEWIKQIESSITSVNEKKMDFDVYNPEVISKQYLEQIGITVQIRE